MGGGATDNQGFLRRLFSAAPELLVTVPFVLWLIFSAGVGVGLALVGGIAVGWGAFLCCAVVLPILFYIVTSLGLGD